MNFYQSLGLTKAWETYQDIEKQWSLVGMRFPDGNSELVLKNNPELNFTEIEIVVEDVKATYETLKSDTEVEWIRTPFVNSLGGHVAVMKASEQCICFSWGIIQVSAYSRKGSDCRTNLFQNRAILVNNRKWIIAFD